MLDTAGCATSCQDVLHPVPDYDLGLQWSNEPIKILGVYFGYDKEETANRNTRSKLLDLEKTLNLWKMRKLTFTGKILIIKVQGLSKFLYLSLLVCIPLSVMKKVNSLIYAFLWGCQDKIKRGQIIQSYELGGQKMLDFEFKIASLQLKWMQRYYSGPCNNTCCTMFEYYLKQKSTHIFLQTNFDTKECNTKLSPFYKEVILHWSSLIHTKNGVMYGSVCNEVLWYNKYIKTDKRTIFYKELADKQIFKVKHILNNDRKIMTFNELQKQYEMPSKF